MTRLRGWGRALQTWPIKEKLLQEFSGGEILLGVGSGGERVYPGLDRALALACTEGKTSSRRDGGEEILCQRRQRGRPG